MQTLLPIDDVMPYVLDALKRTGRLVLQAPPGAGKTVFMEALSGRLRTSESVKVSGSVKYNGQEYLLLSARDILAIVEK